MTKFRIIFIFRYPNKRTILALYLRILQFGKRYYTIVSRCLILFGETTFFPKYFLGEHSVPFLFDYTTDYTEKRKGFAIGLCHGALEVPVSVIIINVLQASSRKDKVMALLTALRKNWKDDYMHRLCEVLDCRRSCVCGPARERVNRCVRSWSRPTRGCWMNSEPS